MPRIVYVEKAFRADTLDIIEQANDICEQYAAMGYELTLRQLYYQFVAKALIENSDRSYKRLGSIVNDARLAGLIDWDHLTDRTHNERRVTTWGSPSSIIDASASQFKRDVWEVSGQLSRPWVWVEKDALVDVVSRAADPLFAPYFSCRGYVSQSEMWAAAQRIRAVASQGFEPVVFHLGDHDPSGIDMSRDIRDRLSMFAGFDVDVRRIALTMAQINQYGPPPNPAKLTDSRGSGYVQRYGRQSWELDALDPPVLVDLIRSHVESLIDDPAAWDDAMAEDAATRSRMQDVASRWEDVYDRWGEIEDLLDS